MSKKNVELCPSVTETFYSDIGTHMVYVTLTVQKLPEDIKNTDGHNKTISEYLGELSKMMSQKTFYEDFLNPQFCNQL